MLQTLLLAHAVVIINALVTPACVIPEECLQTLSWPYPAFVLRLHAVEYSRQGILKRCCALNI